MGSNINHTSFAEYTRHLILARKGCTRIHIFVRNGTTLSDKCTHLRIIKAPSVYIKRILLILPFFVYSDITDTFRPVFAIIREVIHDGLYLVPYICHGDVTQAGS